ncbi:MAG: spermidine synthase [Catenulispora sp.]
MARVPDRRPTRPHGRAGAGRADPGGPAPGRHHVETGTAELLADADDPDGWMVLVNGVPSSYVHLSDPTRLEFEYVRWIGHVLDLAADPGQPLRVAHLGGAGCTLARYVAATRPGSPQVVFEVDAELAALMRSAFGRRGFRVRTADGRAGLAALPARSRDVVVRDAFVGDSVPAHLSTLEFARDTARVLAPGGLYVANLGDREGAPLARAEAATLLAAFAEVAMVGEPGQLRGRRFGNIVLVAGDDPLPLEGLARRLAGGAVRARLVQPDRVRELAAGIAPLLDDPGRANQRAR